MRMPRSVRGLARAEVGLLGAVVGLVFAPLAHAQQTTRVSVDSAGAQANGYSFDSAISADGQVVAFSSVASNLVAGDTNNVNDVFLHDRSTGVTERVSVASSGAQGDNESSLAEISADGQIVAFESWASNLVHGDTNTWPDVFVRDRSTGVTRRVSVNSSGAQGDFASLEPALSADGQVVAFWSHATNLVAGDTNGWTDIFVHDLSTGVTERVSVASSGAQADDDSVLPALSADGRIVAFLSGARNLVAGDDNSAMDIFVHDRATGVTERASVDASGVEANDGSDFPRLSADGRFVVFYSLATNLVPGDTNATADVFVHDRSTGHTERVSVDSQGREGNDASYNAALSADGQIVSFLSYATNFVPGDTNGHADVFVHYRSTGGTARVSVSSTGAQGNGYSATTAISANGRVVPFWSWSSTLVPGDTNGFSDVFVHERGTTRLRLAPPTR